MMVPVPECDAIHRQLVIVLVGGRIVPTLQKHRRQPLRIAEPQPRPEKHKQLRRRGLANAVGVEIGRKDERGLAGGSAG